MLTRSLSYYTLGKQQQSHSHLDFSGDMVVDGPSMPSAPSSLSSLPRSISLQKIAYTSSPARASPATNYKPVHIRAPSRSLAIPKRHRATTLELLDDAGRTPDSPSLVPAATASAIVIDDDDADEKRSDAQPIGSSPHSLPTSTGSFVPTGTSPDGFLQTEAGSLPLSLFRRGPLVGNALVHPPCDDLASAEPRALPSALVEDFEIVGRAGDASTCDTWIVRSKCSGKMAVFKPRDGEAFEQRHAYEEEARARREREERIRRLGAPPPGAMAPASSSCPHPLSLPTSLRTPLKRGVLYGETTRKEVAAYLMDHDHFAGVPKTLEATIWLARQDAPNGGANRHDSGVDNFHPYLHGNTSPPPTGQLTLTAGETSPELTSSQGRLLLQAASISPPLSSVPEPQFAFDPEEVWLPAAAAHSPNTAPASQASGRDMFGGAPSSPRNVPHLASNLRPPPTLFPAGVSPPVSPAAMPTTGMSTPEFVTTHASTPDEYRGLGLGLGLGLPASTSDLVATYGSLQEYVENKGSAEDMGSTEFPTDEVHRIGILDVRLLNLDRHLGNLLVQRDAHGRPHLIPIDHGFCLPAFSDLSDVHLEWTYWRQCMEPFGKETMRYIARLDPIADAAKLRNIGIRDEALVSMVFSSLLLKHAAAEGLTLYHIAQMVQRDGVGDEPSTLENIVARVLGAQAVTGEEEEPDSPDSPPFPFDATTDGLHDVEEESPSAPGSQPISRQHSATSAPGAGPATPPMGFPASPPMSPTAGTSPIATPLMTTLLTRSNSDGAMALAEAMIGRQYSAPAAGASDDAKEGVKRSASSARRPSVADTAKQIIALVDGAASSPTMAPQPAPAHASFADLDLPSPPPILRLGTELARIDGHTAAESSDGGIPTGAKLQRLLHVTEKVIREELGAYCERHNLAVPSTDVNPMPSSSPVAPAPIGGMKHTSPRASAVFNTTLRSSSPRASLSSTPPTNAALRRSRSSSLDAASEATGTFADRDHLLHHFAPTTTATHVEHARRQLAAIAITDAHAHAHATITAES